MEPEEKPSVKSEPMQCVKVYCLSDSGKWDDHGTGHVSVDYREGSEDLGFFVVGAEDNQTLLKHRIRADDIYRRQEDSIIAWKDPDYATELALSFQEPAGCSFIWEHISNAQRNLQFSAMNSDPYQSLNSELRELPTVDLANLPVLHKMVVESRVADQIQLTELLLQDLDFFRKLMELFRICEEDFNNLEHLHLIYGIVKGIISFNSPQIFEKIFGDELIMDIIGSLEYNPDASQVQHHRKFLKEHVVFKEAIPIKDSKVLSMIHQTYRVAYLKDNILAGLLNDATIESLNSIIHSNNSLVVSSLKDDNTFIQELFARLRSHTASADSKKILVCFLRDFCNLSKNLPVSQQLQLFGDLVKEGILDILKDVLQSQNKKLVLIGAEILTLFLNRDQHLLHSSVVKPEGIPLLGLLVKGMITDFGDYMHCQFLEILRSLLEPPTLAGWQRDIDVIDILCENHFSQLIDVIVASCPSGGSPPSMDSSMGSARVKNPKITNSEILSNICDLLCHCVLHHPYITKCKLLLNNFLDKVLLLLHRREKHLRVAAVHVIRTVLSYHDEHLINHITRNNLLKPIVDAFVSNADRDNLLNSTIVELFEYITKENLEVLLKYIVDTFWKDLVKFEHVATIRALKVKSEQSQGNPGPKNSGNVSDPQKRIDERALDKKEEDYFNEDSDEDTASGSVSRTQSQKAQSQTLGSSGVSPNSEALSPRPGRQVAYDDGEDDEDYGLPTQKQSEETNAGDGSGTMGSVTLKRKPLKEQGAEHAKKQRLSKSSKSKETVFVALHSTLSQAVLPGSGSPSSSQTGDTSKGSDIKHGQEKETAGSVDSSEAGGEEMHLEGEETPLVPPKSSTDMDVD